MKILIIIVLFFCLMFPTALLATPENIAKLHDAQRKAIRDDPLRLVENGFLRIKIKDIKPGNESQETFIPLIPNRPQRRFLQLFRKLQATNQPIRIVILKARQWGGTTITDAIMYALTSQQKNINSMIIADDRKGASYILGMAQNYQSSLDSDYPYLAVSTIHNNKNELAFRDTRSFIFVESSENRDAGQKYTLHYLHCSEVSKFHYKDELFGGLLPAVSKAPGSIIVMESTANGIGDYFHSLCVLAQENNEKYRDGDYSSYRGEWLLFFVPFMEHEEYSRPFENREIRQALIDSLDDEEQALLKLRFPTIDGWKYTTLKNLNWRRWVLPIDFKNDLDKFHEMNPSTVDEAFLASGRCKFDQKALKEMYIEAQSFPYDTGYLEPHPDFKDDILFHHERTGYWKIWDYPEKDTEYVLFADVMGGAEVEGANQVEGKADLHSIEVFKRGDILTQVAEYSSRIYPDMLSDELFYCWLCYNKPYVIGVEVNNHGITVVDHLKHRAPVYKREVYDEKTKKTTKKLGWYTSPHKGGTRVIMINDLAAAIRTRTIEMKSLKLIKECMTFVIKPDGKEEAQEGCFDDRVFGAAGALQMHYRTSMKGFIGAKAKMVRRRA